MLPTLSRCAFCVLPAGCGIPDNKPGSNTFATNSGNGSVYIVPEAARPWVSGEFRSILEVHKNSTLGLAGTKTCHPYSAKLTQTDKPVSGFACTTPDRVFLYLSLL